MKKIIGLFVLTLFISGCSTSDKIEENINIVVDKSLIGEDAGNPNDPVNPTESDDQITPFIKGDQYPFSNNTSQKYEKVVTEDKDNYYIQLNYSFLPSQYGNSTALSSCFEKHEFVENEKYYEIKLGGAFYCLYSDALTINLNTPNIVKENNAEQVNGDTYTWTINNQNVRNTDISIKIMKTTKWQQYLIYGIMIGVIVIVVIGALF